MARNRLTNIHLIVDGRGFAGEVDSFEPPKLSLKTEEDSGGLFVPVDVPLGLEKIDTTWTMLSVDAELMRRWGLLREGTRFSLRAALQSTGGAVVPVVHECAGLVREVDQGTWKSGEKTQMKYTANLRYYRYAQDGQTVQEIDADNMVWMVDGVNQLAEVAAALNL